MADIASIKAAKRKRAQDNMDLYGEALKLIGGNDVEAIEAKLLDIAACVDNPEALAVLTGHVASIKAVANFLGKMASIHEDQLAKLPASAD